MAQSLHQGFGWRRSRDLRQHHDLDGGRHDRPARIRPQTTKAVEALTNVVAGGQVVALHGRRAVKDDHWKAECELQGLIDAQAKPHSARTLFSKFKRELVAANRIACEGELSWL